MKLYYGGETNGQFGWAVCNRNLVRELSKLFHVEHFRVPDSYDFDGILFQPLVNADLHPQYPCRGTKNVGYTFNEFPIGEHAKSNANDYDLIFCGSCWCADRLRAVGIDNVAVLVQGIDHGIFKPSGYKKPDGKLRIFSGGKFEYRKGQDIVLVAVRALAKEFQVELTAAWFNIWPATMDSMTASEWIKYAPADASRWPGKFFSHMAQTCADNGVDPAHVEILPPLPQESLAMRMHQTDLGIFPNRCEGGTNLMLMEYLACGKPAIVSNGTGHLDIIQGENCVRVEGKEDENGWVHVPPAAIVVAVEKLRKDHDKLNQLAETASVSVQQWTWERAAKQIYHAIKAL